MADTDAFGDETNVTAATMHAYAAALRKIADLHELAGKAMETNGVAGVRAKNLASGCLGLKKLGKFAGAVVTACHNEVSAEAVEHMENGLLALRQAVRRTKGAPAHTARKAIQEASKRGAGRGAPKPKTQ